MLTRRELLDSELGKTFFNFENKFLTAAITNVDYDWREMSQARETFLTHLQTVLSKADCDLKV